MLNWQYKNRVAPPPSLSLLYIIEVSDFFESVGIREKIYSVYSKFAFKI